MSNGRKAYLGPFQASAMGLFVKIGSIADVWMDLRYNSVIQQLLSLINRAKYLTHLPYQETNACSKSTIETLEKGMKCVQS